MENEKGEIDKFNPYLGNGRRKKHFFENILKPILSGLGGVILIVLFLLGEFHSCSKHKDDSTLLTYTPLVIYRGIEFFWHNDFAGINWDEKLKEESLACLYFLNSSINEKVNPHDLNKQIDEFSKEIKNYPKDKLKILKDVSRLYFDYVTVQFSDGERILINYFDTDKFEVKHSFKFSEIESKLNKFIDKANFDLLSISVKNSYKSIEDAVLSTPLNDDADKNQLLQNYNRVGVALKVRLITTYKKMFNEEINS